MSEYNRKEHLRELHKNRKLKTYEKVDEAIQRLLRAKENINFNSVAKEANVSKATLYNNLDVKERIDSLRTQQGMLPSPKQMKREMDDNNKDVIIASLKRKISKLEEDKKELQHLLKVSYADVYKQI